MTLVGMALDRQGAGAEMRKSYIAAHVYMILGVISGLFYREFTKAHDFRGDTQLAVMHTHLLALGMLGFLIVLALDKQFQLSGTKLFTAFFWFYNAGIAITVIMMGVHGTETVLGKHVPEAVPGIMRPGPHPPHGWAHPAVRPARQAPRQAHHDRDHGAGAREDLDLNRRGRGDPRGGPRTQGTR